MNIYVTVYWYDGFGNDSLIGGIYSSLEKAVASIHNSFKEKNSNEVYIVKTCVDDDMDFDFYELFYNFNEIYDCFGNKCMRRRR